MFEIMDMVAGYVVPVVSIFLSYALGRWQTSRGEVQASRRRAYEEYYRPIVWELYQGRQWEILFSGSHSFGMAFFTLSRKSADFSDPRDLYCLDQFAVAFSDAHIIDPHAPIPAPEVMKQLDALYTRLVIRILCRSLRLERKLHRVRLSQYVLERYLENPSTREHLQREEEQLLVRTLRRKR
jgi:hypothetical protein